MQRNNGRKISKFSVHQHETVSVRTKDCRCYKYTQSMTRCSLEVNAVKRGTHHAKHTCVENHRHGHLPQGHTSELCQKDFRSPFLLFSFTVAQVFTAPTFSHVTPLPGVMTLRFRSYGLLRLYSTGLCRFHLWDWGPWLSAPWDIES